MASSGNHVATNAKHLRVLLPFSCDSLRIPDELAEGICAGEARVVSPSGGRVKVWRVEVGRDGGGAFLGHGWSEFAAACGAGAGWLLVLRHHGGGVLTFKAFDASGCMRDLGTPPAEATASSKDESRRPQFVSVLAQDFKEKMLIPAKFVQHHISEEHRDNRMAVVIGSLGKISHVEIEINQSDMFFRVKVFGPDGSQREPKHKDIRIHQDTGKQQEAPYESIENSKRKKDWPSREGQKKPKGSTVSMNKASKRTAVYEIGPPSWIMKEINTSTLRKKLSLSKSFFDAIGLREPCTVTLKTSKNSAESWQVNGIPCKNNSFVLVKGWMMFCRANSLKEGDICTFNVVETTLWHVVITRYNKKKQESPSASGRKLYSRKPKRKNDRSRSEVQKRPKVSMSSVNKASPNMRCVYEIGPPAWIKKEINNKSIESYLTLAPAFCNAVGLRKPCTITLKTSMSSTRSWQVRAVPYKNSSHYIGGLDWKRFCKENNIKVGDVCTINIVETTLWHVDVAHQ
ncbi:putative B3 domain-containing protein Os04g0347400 isoform X2 [Panicum virgatum]|uniref:putative B3 domain-containing protein Os04g0347400 isoform X2 n=1 Tax=Panicum virgatum TaxID=38727 RepID=UPI0019D5A57B|nr:putative B3 domain-containing protein Os04g0347400 isoform X2 [Panicum virgatum]